MTNNSTRFGVQMGAITYRTPSRRGFPRQPHLFFRGGAIVIERSAGPTSAGGGNMGMTWISSAVKDGFCVLLKRQIPIKYSDPMSDHQIPRLKMSDMSNMFEKTPDKEHFPTPLCSHFLQNGQNFADPSRPTSATPTGTHKTIM